MYLAAPGLQSSLWHVGSLGVAWKLLVPTCGIWFPGQELHPGPLHWKHRVLATGLAGKSPGWLLDSVPTDCLCLPSSSLRLWGGEHVDEALSFVWCESLAQGQGDIKVTGNKTSGWKNKFCVWEVWCYFFPWVLSSISTFLLSIYLSSIYRFPICLRSEIWVMDQNLSF